MNTFEREHAHQWQASAVSPGAGSAVSFRICGRCGVPGQQFVDAVDLVIGDAFGNTGEPDLRVDAVEPGGSDQGVGNRSRLGRRSPSP